MSVTSQATQVRIIAALTEGMSIRATERLTGAHRDTIMRFSVRVGEGCERLHDRLMRDLQVGVVECDEQWDYIAKKQKRQFTKSIFERVLRDVTRPVSEVPQQAEISN